ncbi:MAG: hypothetical protein ACE5OZ_02685 [Candidatus Heimdallarchaeota archaeon]
MAGRSIPEQELGNTWSWFQYGGILFLMVATFCLVWVLFMGILKMNGIEILQKDIFSFSVPLYGNLKMRWWQIETLALGGWIILFTLLVWIKIR